MHTFEAAVTICSGISSICCVAAMLTKFAKEQRRIRDGQKCLLRQQMLNTYYKHKDSGTIRQYEFENFGMSYKAYKALGGNSFIDKIKSDVEEWTVVS